MPAICPNCLRPVRMEAKFCGYCGTNLNPVAIVDEPVTQPIQPPAPAAPENPEPQVRKKTDPEKIRRTVLIAIVILLCLILLATFLIHYWPLIGQYAAGAILGSSNSQ